MYFLNRFALLFLVLILGGCEDKDNDVVEYVDNVKKTAIGTINKLPPDKPLEVVEYTADTLRSPFDATLVKVNNNVEVADVTKINQQPRPDANRPREFLEKYSLNDFSMVGTLMKKNFIWGLVQSKDGMVHAIKVGDYIGENSGHVIEISPDKISLEQTIPNGQGGWMQNKVYIGLKASGSDKNE